MEARDLLSKLEKSSDEKSEVDCTLKLGLEFYQAQPSSGSSERPRQANMPVSRDLHAVPAQMVNGVPNMPYYGAAGRINCSSGTSSFIPCGGSPPPVPGPPSVICNNYGNLYYMNPQNTVVPGNEFLYRPNARVEPSKKCTVCETSTTPLWRKGPDGEKSLCNACGIRYRKGEKAKMEPQ